MKQIEELIKIAELNNEFNGNYNPPWQEEFYEFKYMKNKAVYDICEQLDWVIEELKSDSSFCKTFMNKYHDEALIDCFIDISKNIEKQKELLNSLFLIKKENNVDLSKNSKIN